jgi:acetyltransferase-like isoleucine patch superfamily enzyme
MRLPKPLIVIRTALAQGCGLLLRAVEPLRLRLARFAYEIWGRSQCRGLVEQGVQFIGPITVEGTGNVHVGSGTRLGRGVYFETQGDGVIRIGRNVVVTGGTTIVSYADITIEDYAMFGEYTSIRDANHGMEIGQPMRLQGHTAAPIRIGHDAWVGRGACVLKGVTIGGGAIVGANSVVTKDVDSRMIVAGCPARPIGEREA